MLPVVHFPAAVPVEFQGNLSYPAGLPGEAMQPKLCRHPWGADAASNYLGPHQVETGIKNFPPEGKTGRLKRGAQRRGRALFLIFVSNGRNDIVNGQEGVHYFRVKVLA